MDILKNIRETALTHPKRYAVQSREQKLTYEELEEPACSMDCKE